MEKWFDGFGEKMKTSNGLSAYEVLEHPKCPIKLPSARSMTQASIDFYSRQPQIIQWYNETILGEGTNTKDQ